MKPYKLMCSLFAHTADVKSLCSTRDNGGFVSVSRDLSAKLWNPSSENSNQYVLSQTVSSHKKYVNSVVVAYTVEEYPNGLIITGSNDQTIAFHDIESNKLIAQLKEHDGAVCTLSFDNNSKSNLLFSGSFDCTAKVWNLNNLVKSDFQLKPSITIKGHDLTVWNVLGIDSKNSLLTASADKSIKHWKLNLSLNTADCMYKYVGHSDCVRGLAISNVNHEEFFSCSNDGNVLHWRLGRTTPIRTIRVTDSFLYSINMISRINSDSDICKFITSGEDRSLRIHSFSKNEVQVSQTIVLPCQTLWNAICLPNGNLGVACSDGSIRLFTQNENLMASKTELEEYEKELSQFAIPIKANQEMSKINLNNLPGLEALLIPGKKDGQSLIINNENEAEVYQWDSKEERWIKIGVAVGSAESGGGSGSRQKVYYMGKEYDYLFDIELDDSGQKLKLPYNLSEDPYHAAQKFIHQYELSQLFLDQIAQFLIKNTETQVIEQRNQSTYYDPFTGENRYVPLSSSSSSNYQSSTYVDPFTGSNAYTTSTGRPASISQNIDKPKENTAESNEYYPHLNYILFDQFNLEPIFKKLREIQQELSIDYKNDLIKDANNVKSLENLLVNSTKSNISNMFNDHIDLLFKMIEVWPEDKVFPLIDLVRIIVLNKEVTNHLFRNQSTTFLKTKRSEPSLNSYFDVLFRLLRHKNLNNCMLVTRVLCNLFESFKDMKSNLSQKSLEFILNEKSNIISILTELLNTENKAFQTAFATLMLNYSILFKNLVNLSENFDLNYSTESILELNQYFNDSNVINNIINWDSEALFRLLVSIGTLLSKTDNKLDYSYIVAIAKSMQNSKHLCEDILAKSQKYANKVNKCAEYLIKLLN